MKISAPDVDWLQNYIDLLNSALVTVCLLRRSSVTKVFSAHVTDRARVFCFNNVVIPEINARPVKMFGQGFPKAGHI